MRRCLRSLLPAGAGAATLLLGGVSFAQTDAASRPASQPATAAAAAGPSYPVSGFILQYLRENPGHPPLNRLMGARVALVQTPEGYDAPRAGLHTKLPSYRIADLGSERPQQFTAAAVQRVLEAVRNALTRQGLMGVYVAPDPFEIDETGRDLRPAGQTALHVVITTGEVTELRTLGSGGRVGGNERINHPAHAWLREHSPIKPAPRPAAPAATGPASQPAAGEAAPPVAVGGADSLLRKDLLDDYVFRLNRHPGRRVDVAVSPSPEVGGVTLDYLVTENKPWTLYAQASNTGTDHTDRWRERFGFFHNQLTGRDDILSFDYSTTCFRDTQSVTGSYEARVGDSERWRWRVSATWSEFTASDVGQTDETFTGESWGAGGELIYNVYQRGGFFVDVFAGVRWQNIHVDTTLPGSEEGDQDFLFPRVGARVEQVRESSATHGGAWIEWQGGDATRVSRREIDALGRAAPDDSWAVFAWDLSHSFFLEPVLDPRLRRNPGAAGGGAGGATLAHELYFALRGQYAFDYRLIPQAEGVAGGFYSVRGYPESVAAGDTLVTGTAEYRFHVPHAFTVEPEPRQFFKQPFRLAPQYPFGPPDWDLILRAFVDAGYTHANSGTQGSIRVLERSEALAGAGVGVEFVLKRNLSVRADYGVALKSLKDADVDAGDSRVHFVATILY